MRARTESTYMVTLRMALGAALLVSPLLTHAEKKEFKYTVAAGATVSVVNPKGSVTVKAAGGRQVVISANPASDKVQADAGQAGNRVSVRTHMLNKANGDEGRVDYEVQVPADTNVAINSGSGEIKVENLRGNVTIDSEEGQVEVRGVTGGFVQVQSVNGAITLNNVQKCRVQVASTGGNIQMNAVTGPNVTAKSTTGSITYSGDAAGGGNYLLTNHSGDISISLPAAASVDLTARSVQGSVENELTLQKPAYVGFQPKEGKAVAGTLNAGASSVELRSFSGKIRVKKQ